MTKPITIEDVKVITTQPAGSRLVIVKVITSEPGLYGLGCATFTQRWNAVVTALDPSIDKNSFGLALQAGVDFPLGDGWLLNLDVKKVQIQTDVYSAGTKAGTFKVDPLLLAVGVGKRF